MSDKRVYVRFDHLGRRPDDRSFEIRLPEKADPTTSATRTTPPASAEVTDEYEVPEIERELMRRADTARRNRFASAVLAASRRSAGALGDDND